MGILSTLGFGCTISAGVRFCRTQNAVTPHGCYTADLAARDALRLTALVSPNSHDVAISADYYEVPRPGRPPARIWSVLCADTSGDRDTVFCWDADTAKLTTVGRKSPAPENGISVLSPGDAAECAAGWLHCLGMLDTRVVWSLVEPPHKTPTGWLVNLRAGEEAFFVDLEGLGGGLYFAHAL